jgi:hypothetical protein
MAGARRAGTVVLLILFALGLLLAQAPLQLGAVRLAGMSLLWWYTAVAAPLVAVLVTIGVLVTFRG